MKSAATEVPPLTSEYVIITLLGGIRSPVIAFAAIVLIYGGFNIMGLTMTQKTASLGVMMGQVYAVVPISGILIAIYGILNVVDLCKGYERKEEEEK